MILICFKNSLPDKCHEQPKKFQALDGRLRPKILS